MLLSTAVPVARTGRGGWVPLFGVVGLVLLAAAGVWLLWPTPAAAPTEEARRPEPPPRTTASRPAPAPRPTPPTERETLPPPRVAAFDPPPTPAPPVPKPLPPRLITIDPSVTTEKTIDAPDAAVEVLALNGEDRVVLKGRVKTLTVGAVNGDTTLDASQLQAEEVVFTEDLNGSATVKVRAVGGRVRFDRLLNGSVQLAVDAADGEVTFAEGGGVTGGVVVTVTARRVDARATLSGGAKVAATLTSGGRLQTAVMEGGAVVEYKPATGNTGPLTIERGELRGGAKVVPAK